MEGKVSSVEQEVNQVQGSKGIEEDTAVKDVRMKIYVMCEHTEEFGGRARSRENQSTTAEKRSSGAYGIGGDTGLRFKATS